MREFISVTQSTCRNHVRQIVRIQCRRFAYFHHVLGRARKKMEELERLLEIATKNYIQLGGVVKEDEKRKREERETRRSDCCCLLILHYHN
jgi:hypothetical protein